MNYHGLGDLNLNLLYTLDALLADPSVSRAAVALGVSASAVSQSLARLREHLGDPLFVRSGRGLVATPRAESLRDPVRQALRALDRAFQQPEDFDIAQARRFVIASEDIIAYMLLPGLVQRIQAAGSDCQIDFVPITGAATGSRLEAGDVDFVINVATVQEPWRRTTKLAVIDLGVLIRADHPAFAGDERTCSLDAYCDTRHLLVGVGGNSVRSPIDAALAALGRERRVAVRTAYFMSAPFIVAETDLLWHCHRNAATSFARILPLRFLDPPLPIRRDALHLYWHERLHNDPAHQWLRSLICGVLADG